MKDLAEDYKAIWKKDRGLLGWMAVNFLLNLWLFLMPIVNLNSSHPKVWARYSDVSTGYQQSDWWYLISFSIIALAVGVGHNMISVLIHTRYGKDVARLFLGISCAILAFAAFFLMHIVEEG